MASLSDDLDRFLKTDGLKILFGSDVVRTGTCEPLTTDDIDGLCSMNLDELDKDRLENLMDKAEDLRENLEDEEPDDEASEAYGLWEDRLSEVDDFIDRIRNRLDDLDLLPSRAEIT